MTIRTIDDVLLRLESEYTDGYGNFPLPCPIDKEVELLIHSIFLNKDCKVKEIVSKMNEAHGFVFLAYAERMASLSVREKRVDLLKTGMSALTIASVLVYVKETLPVLSLLYCSAQKLEVELKGLLPESDTLLDNGFKSYVDDFTCRSNEDRSIEAMGYNESDENGFCYKRIW